eukprot:TRINITY_DN486_c0_g1_i1.p1 TRINITY_DN486_c0_g1~~TRINITY_DN486_c0_g1_i1.p1  ORF type:complete len:254 (-),score=61.02 TRINITY_DN486_c0_g1_i1:68-829(-)
MGNQGSSLGSMEELEKAAKEWNHKSVINVLILGSQNKGKSSLINSFISTFDDQGRFLDIANAGNKTTAEYQERMSTFFRRFLLGKHFAFFDFPGLSAATYKSILPQLMEGIKVNSEVVFNNDEADFSKLQKDPSNKVDFIIWVESCDDFVRKGSKWTRDEVVEGVERDTVRDLFKDIHHYNKNAWFPIIMMTKWDETNAKADALLDCGGLNWLDINHKFLISCYTAQNPNPGVDTKITIFNILKKIALWTRRV